MPSEKFGEYLEPKRLNGVFQNIPKNQTHRDTPAIDIINPLQRGITVLNSFKHFKNSYNNYENSVKIKTPRDALEYILQYQIKLLFKIVYANSVN